MFAVFFITSKECVCVCSCVINEWMYMKDNNNNNNKPKILLNLKCGFENIFFSYHKLDVSMLVIFGDRCCYYYNHCCYCWCMQNWKSRFNWMSMCVGSALYTHSHEYSHTHTHCSPDQPLPTKTATNEDDKHIYNQFWRFNHLHPNHISLSLSHPFHCLWYRFIGSPTSLFSFISRGYCKSTENKLKTQSFLFFSIEKISIFLIFFSFIFVFIFSWLLILSK